MKVNITSSCYLSRKIKTSSGIGMVWRHVRLKKALIFYSEYICMAQYFQSVERLNRKIYAIRSLYTDIISNIESFF